MKNYVNEIFTRSYNLDQKMATLTQQADFLFTFFAVYVNLMLNFRAESVVALAQQSIRKRSRRSSPKFARFAPTRSIR